MKTGVEGKVVHQTRFERAIDEGMGFSVSHRFTDVSSGDSVIMYFGNPAGSGRIAHIVAIEISVMAQCWADIYRNNTIVTEGVALTPVNLDLESPIQSPMKVLYGGEYTKGNRVHQTVVPGGNIVHAVGALSEIGEQVKVSENKNLLVEVINRSGQDNDISIRFMWWEEHAG